MNKFKRFAAIIGIILIISLPIASLLIAILSRSIQLLMASIFLAVIIPIMIYIFVTVYKNLHRDNKKEENISDQEG